MIHPSHRSYTATKTLYAPPVAAILNHWCCLLEFCFWYIFCFCFILSVYATWFLVSWYICWFCFFGGDRGSSLYFDGSCLVNAVSLSQQPSSSSCCSFLAGVWKWLNDLSKFSPLLVSLLVWLLAYCFIQPCTWPNNFWLIFFYLFVISTLYFYIGSFIEEPITFRFFIPWNPFPIMLRKNNLGEAHASLLATRLALSMGMKASHLGRRLCCYNHGYKQPKSYSWLAYWTNHQRHPSGSGLIS